MSPACVYQLIAILLLVSSAAIGAEPAAKNASAKNAAAHQWGQWRGPLSTGEAPQASPPLTWDARDGTNIRWKSLIPGRGHSTPIVWGDRIFLTTAIPFGESLPPQRSKAPGNHDNLPVTHRQKFVAPAPL